ncbi:MAG: hypothetical protein M3160_10760 [Candidatus Eremiobacteraeota bacterium]|nr:hypothetical protein [Candidatus Eremiobacteraeota bacterium]
MNVGDELLSLALQTGLRSTVVVGTGKNVGKTTVISALARAANSRGLLFGLTSIGRDGEAVDVSDGGQKPRLFLRPGCAVATARDVLPTSPASELIRITNFATALGPVVLARVRHCGYYEVAGAPTSKSLRGCVQALLEIGCETVLVDGAVDRLAALAGGDDAVIVATGASAARTMSNAVEDVVALVARLRIPKSEDGAEKLQIDGALTAAHAAYLLSQRESRPVVVRDPMHVLIGGKAFLEVNKGLRLRCERPLHVIAATVAPVGSERYFEPYAFAAAVAAATGLSTFDVLAGSKFAA